MAISATSSGLGTPSAQFLSFMQMNQDSTALKSSVKTAKAIELNMQKESVKAAEDMKQFFSSIGKDIKMLVKKTADSLGITTLMAKIMGEDLALSEKDSRLQKIKDRGTNIDKAKSKEQESEEKGPNFIDSLKEAFNKLVPEQTLGEIGTILLLATGAFALAKLAKTFTGLLAPVLKFFGEDLIPSVKELNKDILDSSTGYLGIGGVALTTSAAIGLYGKNVTSFFSSIGSSVLNAGKTLTNAFTANLSLSKKFANNNKKLTGVLTSGYNIIGKSFAGAGQFISTLAKATASGLGFITRLPIISQILSLGKNFVRFLGPIGIVIQAFIGLFTGISNAIKEFKAGGNVFTIVGSFMTGIFDSIVGATLNLLADIGGFILKKIGLVKLGEWVQDLDFTFAGLKDSIMMVIGGLKSAIITAINAAIGLVNFFIPKKFEFPYIPGGLLANANTPTLEPAATGTTAATGTIAMQQGFTEGETIQQGKNTIETKETIKVNNIMKDKTTQLNTVAAAKALAGNTGVNITSVRGPVDNSTVSNQTAVTTSDVAQNHSDTTSAHLLSQVS
jgi:hypothetical protein|tara:strand:+ start:61 stop:1743 length:1683 start_codon:yes stop_codon:yes gene_type:complete